MIHVGVSGITKQLTLEQQAFNDGYNKGDICGCIPDGECCIEGASECISSGLDMASVCDFVNKSQCSVKAVVSNDPGRSCICSLLEYLYPTTLNMMPHLEFHLSSPEDGINQNVSSEYFQVPLWFHILHLAQHQQVQDGFHPRAAPRQAVLGRAAGRGHQAGHHSYADTAQAPLSYLECVSFECDFETAYNYRFTSIQILPIHYLYCIYTW